MAGIQRSNLILTLVILVLAAFLTVWICPYLKIFGHERLCIALYGVLVIIYFYGRAPVVRGRGGAARSR